MSRIETLAEGVTIYALCQPVDKWTTGPVRYVGKTKQFVWHRVRGHISAAKRGSHLPVHRWLLKHADEPCHIRHLEWLPPGADWAAREAYWIRKFKEDGCDMLNLTEGGEGLSGRKFAGTDHAAKIGSALKRGQHFPCEVCGKKFWRKPKFIKLGDCRFCSRSCYQASLRGVSRPVPALCTERGVEAAAAARRSQTDCKRGHPLSGDNLFITSAGSRGCKECRKIHKAKYRGKQCAK